MEWILTLAIVWMVKDLLWIVLFGMIILVVGGIVTVVGKIGRARAQTKPDLSGRD